MQEVKLISVETDADFSDLSPDDNFLTKSNESGTIWAGTKRIMADGQGVRVQMPESGDYEVVNAVYDAIIRIDADDILLTDAAVPDGFKISVVNASGGSIDVKMKTGETETIYGGTITLADGEFCTVIYYNMAYFRVG
jgi:uncharacterized protein YjdB